MDRVILTASEGMILTDGMTYGVRITLGENRDPSEFNEITLAEYEAIMAADEEPITDEDYHAALREFGVDV